MSRATPPRPPARAAANARAATPRQYDADGLYERTRTEPNAAWPKDEPPFCAVEAALSARDAGRGVATTSGPFWEAHGREAAVAGSPQQQ